MVKIYYIIKYQFYNVILFIRIDAKFLAVMKGATGTVSHI